jgi:hypothetical protein
MTAIRQHTFCDTPVQIHLLDACRQHTSAYVTASIRHCQHTSAKLVPLSHEERSAISYLVAKESNQNALNTVYWATNTLGKALPYLNLLKQESQMRRAFKENLKR